MACSTVRYGIGVTRELGMDMQNFGSKNVCVMTDPNLVNLAPVKTAMDSLTKYGIRTTVYDKVRVEPTEQSLKDSIEFAKHGKFDAFIAVRNRNSYDFTCKPVCASNLRNILIKLVLHCLISIQQFCAVKEQLYLLILLLDVVLSITDT